MKIRLIENDLSGAEYKFKPTNRTPETPMGTQVNNEIKKQNAIRGLSEIDVNLSEEEKSRKKKIFKLAKMEALVHSDDKLSSIFKKILEDNPEEKYGYHWNETVMNILFNDYVLNNAVYFEKYKNAVPVEKKRRDRSAINALMKDDGETDNNDQKSNETAQPPMQNMSAQFTPNSGIDANLDEINLFGGGSFDTSHWFVKPQEFKPNDLLVFNKKTGSLIDILSHANLAQQLPKYKSLVNQGIEIVDPKGTTAQNLKVILSKYKIPREIVNALKTMLAQKPQGQMTTSLNQERYEPTTDAGKALQQKLNTPKPQSQHSLKADQKLQGSLDNFMDKLDQPRRTIGSSTPQEKMSPSLSEYGEDSGGQDMHWGMYNKNNLTTSKSVFPSAYDVAHEIANQIQTQGDGSFYEKQVEQLVQQHFNEISIPDYVYKKIMSDDGWWEDLYFNLNDILSKGVQVSETTTSASSGQYSQPAIWAKDKKNMRFARKPAWSGGQIVGESYITDPACFAKYLKALEIDDFLNETYDMAEAAFAEHGSGMSDIERQSLVKALKNVLTNAMKRMGLEPEEYRQNFLTVIEDIKKELNAVDPNALNNDQNLKEHHLDNRDEKIEFIMQNQPYRDRSELEMEDDSEIEAIYNTIESEKESHWLAQEESIQENNNDQQVYNAISKELQQQMNEFSLEEYSFDDDNMHFSDVTTRGAQNKIRLDKLVQFAKSQPTMDQITAFASGFKMTPERLLQLTQSYLGNNLGYTGGSFDTPEQEALANLMTTIEDAQPQDSMEEPVAPATEPMGESMIDQPETSMSMGATQSMSMKNKDGDSGMSLGANVDDISYKQPSTLSVSTTYGGDDLTMEPSISEMETDATFVKKDLAALANDANNSRNSSSVQRAANELANASNSLDDMLTKLNDIKAKYGITSSDDITNIIDLAASKIKQKGMGNSMNENKKHPSQTNLDRIKKENEKNTKQHEKQADGLDNKKVYGFDPANAGTEDIIKAAQYPADKDFYIKDETDDVSFEDLENAADKVGKTGIGPDKQVKRILTPEEEKALAMNRGDGMQDIVYDNKPSQRFEDRMKDDMGDDQYKLRLDKMKMRAGMPMYNKETQPTGGAHMDNKFKHKYNMEDMNETVSASYYNNLGKRQIVEFKIQDVKSIDAVDATFIKLETAGFGNSFTNMVKENHALKGALDDHTFYIKGSEVYKVKNITNQINESKSSATPQDDKFKKMMHLINYNPSKYVKK